jgi:hypothetical protein
MPVVHGLCRASRLARTAVTIGPNCSLVAPKDLGTALGVGHTGCS